METTTIQISKETKEKLDSFGNKGDTYETIISKVYNMAVKEQIREFLLSDKGFVPIEDALERAKAKWQK